MGHVIEDAETRYRLIYYEVLDLLINSIKDRFHQPGYQTYSKLEALLLESANKQDATEELGYICQFYSVDLNADLLKMQLDILATNILAMICGLSWHTSVVCRRCRGLCCQEFVSWHHLFW